MPFVGVLGKRPARRRADGRKVRLRLETLEVRALMSVDVLGAVDGTNFNNSSCGCYPPDTTGTAGPNHVLELVNSSLAVYDKTDPTNLRLVSRTSLASFFAPLGGVRSLSDPVAMYDETFGQFVIGVLDYSGSTISRFDLAVSNDSDPTDGFYMARYDMSHDGVGTSDFADYPKAGYNYDAYVFSFNMFPNGGGAFHVDTLAIDKTSLAGFVKVVPGGHSTLTPAAMEFSNPGDPMWFVESNQGSSSSMRVTQMTNVLSSSPVYTTTSVTVPSYSTNPGTAAQPGGSGISVNPGDGRVFQATYFGGLLVAGHTIGVGGVPHARWYEFDTTQTRPALVQSGTIDQGPGVATYFPTLSINYEYDIGMTFMESSASEYLSMYVTGQSVNDYGSGQMQTPVQVARGTSRYTISRIGDYSGIAVDPADGYTFWAMNEYKASSTWNTAVAGFGVSPNFAPSPGLGQAARSLPATPARPVAPAGGLAPVNWSEDLGNLLFTPWEVSRAEQPVDVPLVSASAATVAAPDLGWDLLTRGLLF